MKRAAGVRAKWWKVAVPVFLVTFVGFMAAWVQRPPSLDATEGMVRLEGECCTSLAGAPSYTKFTSSIVDEDGIDVTVSFGDLVWGFGSVDGDIASFVYTITRDDHANLWGDDSYVFSGESETYQVAGLAVGESVTQGSVTIEVVAIHDLFFNRNNAIDLKVTFDQDRLSDAPSTIADW